MHEFCLDFIKHSLTESTTKHIVVVTHHLPTLEVVAHHHKGSVLNSAFATELSGLIADSRIDAWIYGHSHTNINAEDVYKRQRQPYSRIFKPLLRCEEYRKLLDEVGDKFQHRHVVALVERLDKRRHIVP